jgi:acyl-CoA hydrolase
MMEKKRTVSGSRIVMTELVLPQHTNQLGKLLGGQLMHWIDICAALSAAKHSHTVCVTASVDRIDFHHPISLGDAVILTAQVNRVFRSSMELGVEVYAENFKEGKRILTNSAFLTFVSVNPSGLPVPAPEIFPETEKEKKYYEEALLRRDNRLKSRAQRL